MTSNTKSWIVFCLSPGVHMNKSYVLSKASTLTTAPSFLQLNSEESRSCMRTFFMRCIWLSIGPRGVLLLLCYIYSSCVFLIHHIFLLNLVFRIGCEYVMYTDLLWSIIEWTFTSPKSDWLRWHVCSVIKHCASNSLVFSGRVQLEGCWRCKPNHRRPEDSVAFAVSYFTRDFFV